MALLPLFSTADIDKLILNLDMAKSDLYILFRPKIGMFHAMNLHVCLFCIPFLSYIHQPKASAIFFSADPSPPDLWPDLSITVQRCF